MVGIFGVAALVILSPTPARADAHDDLCAMTGATCLGYGTYTPPPQYRPPRDRPERCLECEARAQRELEENLANMEHPFTAPTLSDDRRSILAEGIGAASVGMVAIDEAFAAALAAPALETALAIGVSLIALDAAVSIAKIAFPDYVHVPAWMNAMSLLRTEDSAKTDTCENLLASARDACASLPAETCETNDDCRTMLDKRGKRLACDRAWLDIRKGQCPTGSSDSAPMRRNAEEVKRCGRMISNKDECCPPAIANEKRAACHDDDNPPLTCNQQLFMTLKDLLSLQSTSRASLCQGAAQNRAGMERCRAAREAEKARCYGGKLDAGHEDALSSVMDHVLGCDSFLETAQWLGVCP